MVSKKILIVGNSYPLAKRLSQVADKVYMTAGKDFLGEVAQFVDIRDDDTASLIDFVKENEVDLTVVVSQNAILKDISEKFQAEGLSIFAPTAGSAEFAIKKSSGKRFLYKLHAPTPRFGIFEKQAMALDYIKDAKYPLVIRTDTDETECDRMMCPTFASAKTFIEDLFVRGEDKVVISEYVYGHHFMMYVITDGYHAIPLSTSAIHKFTESDGGLLTSGCASFVPALKVPELIQQKLFKDVILKALSFLENNGMPYVGILGVDAVMTGEDSFTVLEFKPYFNDVDAQAVLNCIDENLVELFDACANGFFADEYEDVLTNDNYSASVMVKSRKENSVVNNFDKIESEVSYINISKNKYFEYVTKKGDNFVLTSCAKTLSRAKAKLEEDINCIKFDGMKTCSIKSL